MQYSKQQIEHMEHSRRLKLINTISGIKPANLIGTISETGVTNLAIFSSVVHLGSNPALLGFMTRPSSGEMANHTYENIMQNGHYTINHVHRAFVEKAHYTAAKVDRDVSEFELCNLTEEHLLNCKAPYVKESQFKMGMQFLEAVEIKHNGTVMIIGELTNLVIPDKSEDDVQDIDLSSTDTVGISGLNTYYAIEKIATYPYVKKGEIPEF